MILANFHGCGIVLVLSEVLCLACLWGMCVEEVLVLGMCLM